MSTLRTNALEGMDAMNSITIVAGAGNITTTNVQEGLTKVWCRWDTDSSHSIEDSFNVSSQDDDAVGQTGIHTTNDFSGATFCVTALGDDGEQVLFHRSATGNSAGEIGIANYNQDGNAFADSDITHMSAHGDLA